MQPVRIRTFARFRSRLDAPTFHSHMNTSSESRAERRRLPRHQMQVPMLLDGQTHARTIDVSAEGVRFETTEMLAPGTVIVFSLRLKDAGFGDLALQCEGRVVRVEARHERTFVAATIDSIQFNETLQYRSLRGKEIS